MRAINSMSCAADSGGVTLNVTPVLASRARTHLAAMTVAPRPTRHSMSWLFGGVPSRSNACGTLASHDLGGSMARKATSQDVADRAGVSRSAVSFVLNGRADGNIAKDKQLLILAAAKELNYTPNAVARPCKASAPTPSAWSRIHRRRPLRRQAPARRQQCRLPRRLPAAGHRHPERGQSARTAPSPPCVNRQVDALMFAAMSLRQHAPPPGHARPARRAGQQL